MKCWHFHDLHGFKDFIGFVKLCAPNEFPLRQGRGSDEQWTLDLAFEALRFGLDLAVHEKGELPTLVTCRNLVDEAYTDYRTGQVRDGFFKLEEVQKLLRKIPSK